MSEHFFSNAISTQRWASSSESNLPLYFGANASATTVSWTIRSSGAATHGYAIWSARGVRPDFQRRAIEEVAKDASDDNER